MHKKSFGSIIPKANGTLYVKYIDKYATLENGKKKPHYTVESTGSTSRRVAQGRLDELERAFRAKNEQERIENLKKYSEAIQAGIDASKPKTPILGMFGKYLEVLAASEDTITDSTKRVYGSLCRSFTDFMLGKSVMFVEDVETEQVKEFLARRKGELGIERFYQTHDILNNMYDRFVKAKMLIANPFKGTLEKKAHVRKQKRDVLTDDELRQLLEYKKDDCLQFLFVCSLYTGLRLSDCCCLKWSEVDLEQNILKVIPMKTQRHMGEPINIPIHPLLLKEIGKASLKRKDEDIYVYPENAISYGNNGIGGKVNGIFHKLGLNKKRKTFHSLRHTFISNSCNNGTSIQVLQRLVGHSSVKMSMAYYHENREVMDNAINVLPDYTKKRGDDYEIVRLPKELCTMVREKGKDGETFPDTLKRLLQSTMHKDGDSAEDEARTEVEKQIGEVGELIEDMLLNDSDGS